MYYGLNFGTGLDVVTISVQSRSQIIYTISRLDHSHF